jgi:hypothetical protein
MEILTLSVHAGVSLHCATGITHGIAGVTLIINARTICGCAGCGLWGITGENNCQQNYQCQKDVFHKSDF